MRSEGFTYIEALIATVLMAVALAPILHVLSPPQSSVIEQRDLYLNSAREGMEGILALDYNAITVGTALSDTPTIGGKPIPRNVTVGLYDINGDMIPEPDAKIVTVSVEGITLVALRVNY
jgi:Tfp pilus assembly protein PilV